MTKREKTIAKIKEDILKAYSMLEEGEDFSPKFLMEAVGLSVNKVKYYFGSWQKAQLEVGIEKPYERFYIKNIKSEQEILDDIQAVYDKYIEGDGYYHFEVYIEHGKFSEVVVREIFGSWHEALLNLGIEVRKAPKLLTHEDLSADLIKAHNELELDYMKSTDYEKVGFYSYTSIVKFYGSWHKALKEAGLPYGEDIYASLHCEKKLLKHLHEVSRKLKKHPSIKEYFDHKDSVATVAIYKNKFGSWSNALELAKCYGPGPFDKMRDTEVLGYLRLADKRIPGGISYSKYQEYEERIASPRSIHRRFGTWSKALELAGIDNRN